VRRLLSVLALVAALSADAQVTCVGADCQTPDDSFTTIDMVEDFISGGLTTLATGALGMSFTALSTGTGLGTTSVPALQGAFRFQSHVSNDNSGVIIGIGSFNSFSTFSSQTVWTSKDWSFDCVFQPGSNSTAATNVGMFFGLAAAFTTDPMAGVGSIGVRWDSDRSDTTFMFVTCDSSTTGCGSNGDDTNQAVVASTITPVAGTNYRMRIRRAAAGVGGNPTLYFRINDEAEKTFCAAGCDDVLTQAPAGTVALSPVYFYVTRTTTGVLTGDLDYLRVRIPGVVRY